MENAVWPCKTIRPVQLFGFWTYQLPNRDVSRQSLWHQLAISLFHQVISLTWPDGYILIIFVEQEKNFPPHKKEKIVVCLHNTIK